VINRRGRLVFTGDVDVWIEDFADKPYQWQGKTWYVTAATKAWAKQNPTALFDPKPEKQGPWCTARSATNMDRYVQCITELNGGVTPVNDSGFIQGIEGHSGMARAASYVEQLKFALELPSYEDVAKDPDGTPVPAKADQRMLMAYMLAGRVQPDGLDHVIQYMTKDSTPRMPKDMAVTFVSSLLRRDYKNFIFHPAMVAWKNRNANLLAVINAIT